ncbi:het domain protein [Moniliophthora roreri]|uniref:Heterokaryon incompatibility domain-containing protein n=1 Tax=Moniliophthora roreri TaxID=221103 RepID=A0A0W0F563_MONRR|nr:het domain protein [Moniliophthora roreri]
MSGQATTLNNDLPELSRLQLSPNWELLRSAMDHFTQFGPHSLSHPNLCLEILVDLTWKYFYSRRGTGTAVSSQADPVMLFLRNHAASRITNLQRFEATVNARTSQPIHVIPPYSMSEFGDEFLHHFVKEMLYRVYPSKSVLSRLDPGQWQEDSISYTYEDLDPRPMIPPTEIDFEQPDLHIRGPSSQFVNFPDMTWLGGQHDGYSLCLSVSGYMNLRYMSGGSRGDDAALWQAAMTFGLLEAIMEIKIPSTYLLFLRPDGSFVLNSRNVSALVLDWRRRLDTACRHNSIAGGRWVARVERVITDVLDALDDEHDIHTRYASGHLSRAGCSDREVANILCVLATICDAVKGMAMGVIRGLVPITDVQQERLFGTWSHQWTVAVLYRQMMQADGWCPTIFSRIHGGSLCLLAYTRAHQPFIRNVPDEHQHCREDHCAVACIDTATYRTRHVTGSCQCTFIRPPMDHILHSLEHGNIPIIVAEPHRGPVTVRLSSDGPYIAISHVWADGLGSTSEDGLPSCQMDRLIKLVQHLLPDSEGAFWIDSLCVPAERAARKRAIILMAQTYQQAEAVLVIDASIIAQCSVNAPLEENLLRIATSSWMSRVWTLQEGILARRLHFVFFDGVVAVEDLQDRDAFQISAGQRSLSFLLTPGIFANRLVHSDPTDLLGTAMGELAGRTTSKSEDETVAIAVFLGVDPAHLLAYDAGKDRMKALLLEVQGIPKTLLFTNDQKLTEPGFRWAPHSLTSTDRPWPYDVDALCTAEGLLTEFDILSFAPVELLEGGISIYNPPMQTHYRLAGCQGALDGEIQFNAILLIDGLPDKHRSKPCAAVHISVISDSGVLSQSDEESLVICEYRTYLEIENRTDAVAFTTRFGLPIRPSPIAGFLTEEVHVLVT